MLVERVTVTERGITRRSWRGTQHLEWPSIVDVGLKDPEHVLVLEDLDGLLSMMPFLERHFGSELSETIGFVLPKAA